MKTVLSIVLVMFLTICIGCGNVPANYGGVRYASAKQTVLPDQWKWHDQQQPVLWEMPGHSKAFFAQWDDLKIALAKAEYVADKGSPVAARDAVELKALVRQNLCIARVALFYISDTPMPLKRGDVEITFDNGDVIKDQGVLFWEKEAASSDKHNSRNGTININNRWRKPKEPLLLRILVPEQYLGTRISSISFPAS